VNDADWKRRKPWMLMVCHLRPLRALRSRRTPRRVSWVAHDCLWLVPLLMVTQTRPLRHLLRCFRRASTVISLALRHVPSPCVVLLHVEMKAKAHYTDPATGLRYHDKNVYQLIKGLVGPQAAHVIVTLTRHPLEHGCSARLPGGTRCEPHREVARHI